MSYDYLRAISCISVVILHVASVYLKDDFADLISETDWVIASFWRVLTNLAVPSFVMLSGAFIIKSENACYKEFYTKMFKRILLPTLIFSAIYVFMHYAEIMLAQMFGMEMGADKTDFWSPLINLISGKPHGTMWYMFMIIPLYCVTPVIVLVKASLSAKWYRRLAVIMMFYGLAVTRSCSLSWILQFVCWLGYFLLGDVIREWTKDIKNNRIKGRRRAIATGLLLASYTALILYWYMFTYRTEQVAVPSSFSWIIVCATIMQFIGFSLIPIENSNGFIKFVAKYSLEIYLIHPIFVEVYMQLFGRLVRWLPVAGLLPFYSLLIAVVCAGIILRRQDKKTGSTITDRTR